MELEEHHDNINESEKNDFEKVLNLIDNSLITIEGNTQESALAPSSVSTISELSGELLRLQTRCRVLEQQNALLLSSRPMRTKSETGMHFRRASDDLSGITVNSKRFDTSISKQHIKTNENDVDSAHVTTHERILQLINQVSQQVDDSNKHLQERTLAQEKFCMRSADANEDFTEDNESGSHAVALINAHSVHNVLKSCAKSAKQVLLHRSEMNQFKLDTEEAQVFERKELMNFKVECNKLKENEERYRAALQAADLQVRSSQASIKGLEQQACEKDQELEVASEELLLLRAKLGEYSQENVKLRVLLSEVQRHNRDLAQELADVTSQRDDILHKYKTLEYYTEKLSAMR